MQAIRQEPHLRFHLMAAAFVLYFQRYFALERSELALLILTIALVISAELVNTAIERTVDLCWQQERYWLTPSLRWESDYFCLGNRRCFAG